MTILASSCIPKNQPQKVFGLLRRNFFSKLPQTRCDLRMKSEKKKSSCLNAQDNRIKATRNPE